MVWTAGGTHMTQAKPSLAERNSDRRGDHRTLPIKLQAVFAIGTTISLRPMESVSCSACSVRLPSPSRRPCAQSRPPEPSHQDGPFPSAPMTARAAAGSNNRTGRHHGDGHRRRFTQSLAVRTTSHSGESGGRRVATAYDAGRAVVRLAGPCRRCTRHARRREQNAAPACERRASFENAFCSA